MALIPEADLQRLKEEVAVVRMAEASGLELKKSGGDFVVRCPVHADTTKSLPPLDVPSVNQRSSNSLCAASKTVSAYASCNTAAACKNVTPCLVIFD